MKEFIKYLLVLTILFIGADMVNAQVQPNVSTKYGITQFEEMYKKHKYDKPRDIIPPAEITSVFTKDFPEARDIEWEKSEVMYEVEFEIGWLSKDDYKAYYDLEGNLIMYRAEIPKKQLPAVVKNAALTEYPKFRFDDTYRIIIGKDTLYKVSLEKGKQEVKMTLTDDGTITNQYFD